MGVHVASIEPNDESGGYDVQVRVEMVPTLSAINQTEQMLAAVAEKCGGRADGWGVKQES